MGSLVLEWRTMIVLALILLVIIGLGYFRTDLRHVAAHRSAPAAVTKSALALSGEERYELVVAEHRVTTIIGYSLFDMPGNHRARRGGCEAVARGMVSRWFARCRPTSLES